MKSVVLCGSTRFKPGIRAFAADLKKHGVVVYEPYLHEGGKDWETLSDDDKRYVALGLTLDHFYKLRQADVVFIYNQDRYAGVSTTMEIGYAASLDKPIYALEADDPEWARRVLIRGITPTPGDLMKKLQ